MSEIPQGIKEDSQEHGEEESVKTEKRQKGGTLGYSQGAACQETTHRLSPAGLGSAHYCFLEKHIIHHLLSGRTNTLPW